MFRLANLHTQYRFTAANSRKSIQHNPVAAAGFRVPVPGYPFPVSRLRFLV